MPTTIQRESGGKKHEELEAQWRQRIQEGEWQPGERLPTFADLCDQHSVSRTTVERVCRSLEQDGLIVRRQGSGTYIAEVKPPVATGFIGLSGFCFLAGPRDNYWSQLQNGVQEVARVSGKRVVLLDDEIFGDWNDIDGLVMSSAAPESIHTQRMLASLPNRMPRVSMLFNAPSVPSVVGDDYQGGFMATEHLLELGHRRIACLMDTDHPLSKRRTDGYRDAMRRAGIEPEPRWHRPYNEPGVRAPHFIDRGAELMRAWMQQGWHDLGCTAMLLQNDMVAIGAMAALQQAGISVPQQVSVIGFDNIEICNYISPRLTSVDVPLRQMGVMATEMLMKQINTGSITGSTTILPVQLCVRDSTTTAPTGA